MNSSFTFLQAEPAEVRTIQQLSSTRQMLRKKK